MNQSPRHDQAIGPHERLAGRADPFLAVGGQGDVGCAGVFPGEGPFGFAVAEDEAAWCGHWVSWLDW